MPFKVAITSVLPTSGLVLGILDDAGVEVVRQPCRTEDQVIEAAGDADAVLVHSFPLTGRRVLEALPRVKAVSRRGVGVDSVDLDAATELGICVCNIPGVNTTEVAEHALALLLSVTRRIPMLSTQISQGAWTDRFDELQSQVPRLMRVAGSVVGIIGLGAIGKAFAARVRGLEPSRIIAYDPYVDRAVADQLGAEMVTLDTLLAESDYISLHMPVTDETRHMIDRRAFERMKPTAVLINSARGSLVDETALCEALASGRIAGAGIDATETEPIPTGSPLLKLDNLVVTPHFAAFSPVSLRESDRGWAENAVRVLEGRPPLGLANPGVTETIALLRSRGDLRWQGVPEREAP